MKRLLVIIFGLIAFSFLAENASKSDFLVKKVSYELNQNQIDLIQKHSFSIQSGNFNPYQAGVRSQFSFSKPNNTKPILAGYLYAAEIILLNYQNNSFYSFQQKNVLNSSTNKVYIKNCVWLI